MQRWSMRLVSAGFMLGLLINPLSWGTNVTTLDAAGVWPPISRIRGTSSDVIESQSVSSTFVSPTSANANGVDIPLGLHHAA